MELNNDGKALSAAERLTWTSKFSGCQKIPAGDFFNFSLFSFNIYDLGNRRL